MPFHFHKKLFRRHRSGTFGTNVMGVRVVVRVTVPGATIAVTAIEPLAAENKHIVVQTLRSVSIHLDETVFCDLEPQPDGISCFV